MYHGPVLDMNREYDQSIKLNILSKVVKDVME